jgi:hypothetical protein
MFAVTKPSLSLLEPILSTDAKTEHDAAQCKKKIARIGMLISSAI